MGFQSAVSAFSLSECLREIFGDHSIVAILLPHQFVPGVAIGVPVNNGGFQELLSLQRGLINGLASPYAVSELEKEMKEMK